jgi:diaminobutyrate-2-oxoglutarate transaminase
MRERLLEYIMSHGLVHALDFHTEEKAIFIERFVSLILEPRTLDYKLQFCGPTGTNAVEAALKLARRVTQRTDVWAFMGSFHGVTMGSLSTTSARAFRHAAGVELSNTTFLPYPCGPLASLDTIKYIQVILNDDHSGSNRPAAIIFETVQCEGGVYVAPEEWMRDLSKLCARNDILLICDDIQAGCGRTGPFFSFERAGITPDITLLSKSLSGYGLPMSLVLMKPHLDQWKPGEHNGTFRGHQFAFVTATAALEMWRDDALERRVRAHAATIRDVLKPILASLSQPPPLRGLGAVWGIDLSGHGGGPTASNVVSRCFNAGVVLERCGRGGSVVKLLPPLVIPQEMLVSGCVTIGQAILEELT